MGGISRVYRWINDLHASIPRRIGNGWAFPPLRVGCVLTHRCNLRCRMCFVWKHGIDGLEKGELTTDEWLGIFKQIPSTAIITFTGGEPLVRDDIRTLLDAACRRNRVHFVSNGTMIRDNLIGHFVELAPRHLFGKGLLSVGISLEGPREQHDAMVQIPGSFDRTTGALRELVAEKRRKKTRYPILDMKIVICRETIDSLVNLYDLADEIGLDMISYQQCNMQESSYGIDAAAPDAGFRSPPPIDEIPREQVIETIRALKERSRRGRTELRFNPDMNADYFARHYRNDFPLREFTCSAAWSVMHIGPYGTVFPCFSIPMGNLRTTSLRDIWNGEPYRDFRRKILKAGILPGCTGCCVMKLKSDDPASRA